MSTFGAGNLLGVLSLILFPESMMSISGSSFIQKPGSNAVSIDPAITMTVGLSVMFGFSVMVIIDEIVSRMFKSSLEAADQTQAHGSNK